MHIYIYILICYTILYYNLYYTIAYCPRPRLARGVASPQPSQSQPALGD